jgi:hypothetical protein
MRGIGYRSFVILNDFHFANLLNYDFLALQRQVYTNSELTDAKEFSKAANFDFTSQNYLMLRAGHTSDLHLPLSSVIKVANSKKNRKLTIVSSISSIVSNITKRL